MANLQSANDKPGRKSAKAPLAVPDTSAPPPVAPASAQPAPVEAHAGETDFAGLKPKLESYLKPEDVERVELAYNVARSAHEGQYRKSGEPYITHPLAVAKILADWHLDATALIAGTPL